MKIRALHHPLWLVQPIPLLKMSLFMSIRKAAQAGIGVRVSYFLFYWLSLWG